MEDDVQYISVVFQNKQPPQTANKDEQTLYSEVNLKPEPSEKTPKHTGTEEPQPPDSGPKANKDEQTLYSEMNLKPEPSEKTPKHPGTEEPQPPDSGPKAGAVGPVLSLRVLTVLVVCLCALLGSVAGLVYLSISTTNQRSENLHLSSEMSLLQEESVRLKGQWAELQNLSHNLQQQRDQLNWTLQVILGFSQFPVSDFCPNEECRPCLEGWLLFENSCYLFYESNGWKTWSRSQDYCKQKSAISGLVVVNSLQEQEFIHRHIKYYYDEYHGYWIGLSKQNQTWVWDDGQVDTLGFWVKKGFGTSGPNVLVMPTLNVTESWDPAEAKMRNKFICESKALVRD